MKVTNISIKNFKSIQKLDISPTGDFNVIIGENNQGKTSVFEALQLWHRCYHKYIQTNGRKFYKGNNLHLAYKDLNFIRLTKDTDLFKKAPNVCKIALTFNTGTDEYTLTFKISRPKVIENAYFRIDKEYYSQFEAFAIKMQANDVWLHDAIFIYQTNPVANVLAEEPFLNKGQITKKIIQGKSNEVLRNKIRNHSNLGALTQHISAVLAKSIQFHFQNAHRADRDEFIKLYVEENGKQLDLHLQGSGLLQVAEIFATLNYLDAELNILLIDEPDSHIHAAMQKRLIQNLRELPDNQTFIISHNDVFVNEVNDGELFYLNSDAKAAHQLNPLSDFDLIKKDFGSPIVALEKLNHSSRIVFVEGKDDKANIERLLAKCTEAGLIPTGSTPAKCQFFQIRGKDNLKAKMEHNKRTLSQLFRDKTYVVLTDKDFTPFTENNALNQDIAQKLGNGAIAFSHDGYCMESTLFSDLGVFYDYLDCKLNADYIDIKQRVESYLDQLLSDLRDVRTTEFQEFNAKFDSQKWNRPELQQTNFADVVRDASQNRDTLKYIMNKGHIRKLIEYLESHFSEIIVPIGTDDSTEYFCGKLLMDYIDSIPDHNYVFEEHKTLLNNIYGITIT